MRKPAAAPTGEVSTAKLEADGGLAVILKLRKEGEDTWVSVAATGAEGDAKKTADEITARAQGWEFKVPAYKAQSILKRRADLFEVELIQKVQPACAPLSAMRISLPRQA